jgi:hypothetical protein
MELVYQSHAKRALSLVQAPPAGVNGARVSLRVAGCQEEGRPALDQPTSRNWPFRAVQQPFTFRG